jgi:peptidoglycan/xylan/chitin deacetylase (PgdA/CDA1 family)
MTMQRIPILCYHSVAAKRDPRFAEWTVSPEDFAAQMSHLAENGYRALTVAELVDRAFSRRESIDPKTVAITFDDGFADFYLEAWPVLRRHSYPATVYVATGFVGETSRWLAPDGEADRPMLSWSQIEELGAAGIELGAHGHDHVQLDTVSAARADRDIRRSRDALEKVVGPVKSFAYPHGYYTGRVKRQVAQAGFASACGMKHALSNPKDDRYAIARAVVRGGVDLDGFARLMRGEGIGDAPGARRLRRGAWRTVRRAGAEPLVRRLRRHSTGAEVG